MTRSHPERGSVSLFVAVGMIAMIGFAALAVDVGYLFATRWRLQYTSDAVAMTAAQNILTELSISAGETVALGNGLSEDAVSDPDSFQISLGTYTDLGGFINGGVPADSARVQLSASGDSIFANAIGFTTFGFNTLAIAKAEVRGGTVMSMGDITFENDAKLKAKKDADVQIHANGDITAGGQFKLEADGADSRLLLEAGGEISPAVTKFKKGGQVVLEEGAARVTLPSVDYATLKSQAVSKAQYYPGSVTLPTKLLSGMQGTVFVDGNLTISSVGPDGKKSEGKLNGVTIVATGNVTVMTDKLKGEKGKSDQISVYIISGQDLIVDPCTDKLEWVAFRSDGMFEAFPSQKGLKCDKVDPDPDDESDEMGKTKLKNTAIFAVGPITIEGILKADFKKPFRLAESPFGAPILVRLVK